MEDGTFLVFDGYYAGIGYQRSQNMCSYAIQLVHWLDDLNCSSILNGDWSPNVPGDLAQGASFLALSYLTGGGGSGAQPGTVNRNPGQIALGVPFTDHKWPKDGGDGSMIVTTKNMTEDLWEKVIKRIFEGLCDLRHPKLQCPQVTPPTTKPAPNGPGGQTAEPGLQPSLSNAGAWSALRRMPGKAPEKYRAKLPLNLTGFESGDPATALAHAAEQGISQTIANGLGHNSFWSKLIGDLAPQFFFAVSPSVEFAQAIPFFPGLNKPHVTITGEEYNYATFNTNCAHMLSAIVIQRAFVSSSGAGQAAEGASEAIMGFCEPAGFYPKDKADYNHHWGNILVRQPPAWLASTSYYTGYTRGNQFNYQGRSSLCPQKGDQTHPEEPKKPRENEKDFRDIKDGVDGKDLNIFDRFACHWYKSAMLGQRYGELSGKLRFDIAPGSIVEIEPAATAIGKEKENASMFGAVVQVSFVINAEQHTAGTSFTLSHMRTKHENDISNAASKTHFVGTKPPMYLDSGGGSPWPGGPLIIAPKDGGTGLPAVSAPTGTDGISFVA
jgi:hypothetical protein